MDGSLPGAGVPLRRRAAHHPMSAGHSRQPPVQASSQEALEPAWTRPWSIHLTRGAGLGSCLLAPERPPRGGAQGLRKGGTPDSSNTAPSLRRTGERRILERLGRLRNLKGKVALRHLAPVPRSTASGAQGRRRLGRSWG